MMRRSHFSSPLSFEGSTLRLSFLPSTACAWRWRTFSQGLRPHHGVCCDAPQWRPRSCSWGRVRCQMMCHIHSNFPVNQGAWCHSTGRGNPSIPVPITRSYWWWMVAQTALPSSMWSFPPSGFIQWKQQTGPPSELFPRTQRATGGSHPCPFQSIWHDPLTKTELSRGALRRGVMW